MDQTFREKVMDLSKQADSHTQPMLKPKLPPLISALLDPARYPDPALNVECLQTHISWVLLAGEFAYKIKKPLTLPFLDYGTLAQRHLACEDELRLNRRYAPDLYLGVLAIGGTPDQPVLGRLGEPADGAIEYALKMRRFDEAGRLDHVCARGELTLEHIRQLADGVVALHRAAAVAAPATPFGAPEQILAQALENFDELETLLLGPEDQAQLASLRAWTNTQFARLQTQFGARKAAGFVRECHGDLHLGNLVLIDGRVTMFDCIEFNEALRWIDVASEIAFTYIDLLDHDQAGLAGCLLNQWLSDSGDYAALAVMRFYAVYRALVRAKVAALRSKQDAGADMAQDAGADEYAATRAWLALAQRVATPARACLTITHGLSGCGKSTVALQRLLADPNANTLCLRSDVERKRLFKLAERENSASPLDGGIYHKDASKLTYQHLADLALQLLAAGWSVIVDAAFLQRAERDRFRALALQAGVDFAILAPQAPAEQLASRIETRRALAQDASEATLAVLEQQMNLIEPLDQMEQAWVLQNMLSEQ
jgi:uncharacterized protein